MIDMHSVALKAGATVLAFATTVAAALFVTAHLKNPSAPLQPVVLSGTLTVLPSVRPSDVAPVTSTYAS